jgi:murein tripeptide amidase MpaA
LTYLNVDEVESAIINLSAKYQDLCRLVTLANPTIEGRISHALNIGKELGSKNMVFLTGGVHAREWGSSEICIYLAADLLEAYSNNTGLKYGTKYFDADDIESIIENLNILIFPCVNPDGRYYSQTSEPLWRHNRNPSESCGIPKCVGVDINRNYDFLWDFNKHFSPNSNVYTSNDPCFYKQIYRGSAPFSEPETQNVKWLYDNYPMIKWYVDIHSYGNDILYSWGDDENQTENPGMNFIDPLYNSRRGVENDNSYKEYIPKADLDTAIALANSIRDGIEAVRGKKYDVKPGFHLYPTSGAGDDYAYSRHFSNPGNNKVLAFTLEWGEYFGSDETSFHPKWDEMKEIVIDVNAGLLEFCLKIGRRS